MKYGPGDAGSGNARPHLPGGPSGKRPRKAFPKGSSRRRTTFRDDLPGNACTGKALPERVSGRPSRKAPHFPGRLSGKRLGKALPEGPPGKPFRKAPHLPGEPSGKRPGKAFPEGSSGNLFRKAAHLPRRPSEGAPPSGRTFRETPRESASRRFFQKAHQLLPPFI